MSHIYRRELDASANDSLAKIAKLIQPGASVLDVGTGSGALGAYLQSCGHKIVDGITYSVYEAEYARPFYSHLKIANLEELLPSSLFKSQKYDFIVCADILEHLRNAKEVLADLRNLLTPDGQILVSVPNVTHLGVLLSLASGEFVRTQEGLLDQTHVHFFRRQSFVDLVHDSGFVLAEQHDVVLGLEATEFSSIDVSALPPAVRSYLCAIPDAFVYQFVWLLRPVQSSDTQKVAYELPSVPQFSLPIKFRVQLFLDTGDGFSENNSLYAWGNLVETPQTLRFLTPNFVGVKNIRFDFTDRPGVFEFFGIQALNSAGACVWRWEGDWSFDYVINQLQILPTTGLQGGRLFRSVGDDPFVIFCVEDEGWSDVSVIELSMTPPHLYHEAAFAWATVRTENQVSKLTDLLIEANQKNRHLEGEVDHLSVELNRVYQSRSWRITAWLRYLSARLSQSLKN